MITEIPTYDFQLVPADYDKTELPFFDPELEDSVKITHHNDGAKYSFPANIPDEILQDICVEIWVIAQQRLNEFRQQELEQQCGF